MSVHRTGQSMSLVECHERGLRYQTTDPTRSTTISLLRAIGVSVLQREEQIHEPTSSHATLIGLERLATAAVITPALPLVNSVLKRLGLTECA